MEESQWQLQNAKSHFSQVVNNAINGAPQLITKNGKPAVYIISAWEYSELTAKKSFKEMLLSSPHKDIELDLTRDSDTGRSVEL